MNLLSQSAFLKALGWALLDSVWQMGLLWLLYVLLTANGKRLLARQRHSIALLSLAGGSLWFVITLIQYCYKATITPAIIPVYLTEAMTTYPTTSVTQQVYSWLEPALSYLSTVYLIVIVFLFIRFYRQYRHTQQLFTEGLRRTNPEWRAFLQQAAGHMGIKKNVQIWLSSMVDTPLTVGFWKPVILLPIAAVNHLGMQQAEAIILHELNHIRRNDYLVNLLIACVDIILFFNPFARLITDNIRKEREHSCDDMVLQFRYDASLYAKALLVLEQNRLALPALAVAATGSKQQLLLNRVKRILTNEPVTTPLHQKLVAYLFSAMLIGFIGWYNPGKVIVQTIREVNTPGIAVAASTSDNSNPVFAITATTERCDKQQPVAAPIANAQDEAPQTEDLVLEEQLQDSDVEEQTTLDMLKAKLDALEHVQIATMPDMAVEFIQDLQVRDFSLPEVSVTSVPHPNPAGRVYPYVPNNSFSYQPLEDTAYPKKYVQTFSDQQAKAALEKALKALQEIDWQKMEKELNTNGKKLDIVQLQQELKKAFGDVNWKKINDDVQAKIQDGVEDVEREQNMIRLKMQKFQEQQERMKKVQQQVLLDRLQQVQTEKRQAEERRERIDTIRTRKIVVI